MAFPQTCRHFSQRSLTLPLELMGTELIKMLMAPNTIVETLDVIEDFRLGFCPSLVNPLLDLFALQITEERFGHRVISALPRRLMLGLNRLSLHQRLNSSLLNWLP